MTKRRIVIELDEATVGRLAVLGHPIDVLVRLAESAVDIVRRRTHDERTRTDRSLQLDRNESDDVIVLAAEATAATLRVAQLEDDRCAADAVVERDVAWDPRSVRLLEELAATDQDLGGERARLDALIQDQREANQQMVAATMWAHDLVDVAAMQGALASERALAEGAEFREMFLGIVGDDLWTPLRAILTGAESMLESGRLDEHDVRTITRLIRFGQRMQATVTQLLDLTRPRLGSGIPIARAPTDLGNLCKEIVEEFRIPIELKIEGDLTGHWDRGRLAEVLTSLTGNAVRHAATGTFVVINAYAAGAEVVVEVSNHGESIPAELLPSIFEAASRQSSTPRSAFGVGLYIAKLIVHMHGGTLEVRSAAGATTFSMRLPRTDPDAA